MDASTSPRGDALIMFGLTGDLGRSKIIPALAELRGDQRLEDIPLVGVGRTERTDGDLRALVRDALPTSADVVRSDLAARLRYVQGDATEVATFDALADRLDDARNPVVYAAVPPAVFGEVAHAIEASRLPEGTRIVVEKPFGSDAASARALFDDMMDAVGAERVFIVDHFLAKAAVENLLTVRTTNALLDTVLHRRAVKAIRVEMLEREDVAGRGSFYEQVGVVDDVVQNHLVQLAALALMERPADDSDESYHAARSATIRAMSIDPDSVVLGQYVGYGDHDDVDADSDTPTFCSFTLSVDADRWRGVPIEVVGGKALDTDSTAVVFELVEPGDNTIRFGVKPDATIAVDIQLLDSTTDHHAGASTSTRRSQATLCGPNEHGRLGDYATLLDDALDGTKRHFAHIDDVVHGWELVATISGPGHDERGTVRRYDPGTAGPS
jgi:glucose-6-phosphate 1-dehydrogenase